MRWLRPSSNARFNVRVNQSLPFLRFSNADWEALVDVRNMFREADADASIYDEALADPRAQADRRRPAGQVLAGPSPSEPSAPLSSDRLLFKLMDFVVHSNGFLRASVPINCCR